VSDFGPIQTQATVASEQLAETERFLGQLFEPEDIVLLRLIESWTEGNRKKTKILYKQGVCATAGSLSQVRLYGINQVAALNRANLFFGVCPRLGNEGYDKAWQIRTVRCLWADLDHITPDDAWARCAERGVPQPSLVVSSGHGAHLYWKLERPLLIADAGSPSQVRIEWTDADIGRRPIEWIDVDGERVELRDRRTGRAIPRNIPPLSPQAEHIQDVLAGLARVLDADHTHDLSRLLRLPGTFNRKGERNGKPPVLTTIVRENDLRYEIGQFEQFAGASPQKLRREEIARIPLPALRKLTASRRDKLDDKINACRVAPAGQRSEVDFALCAFAIRQGRAAGDIWPLVSDVGKFSECGEPYFRRTWEKAEQQVRLQGYEKAQKAVASASGAARSPRPATDDRGDDRQVIEIDVSCPVAPVMAQITDVLLAMKCCYDRAGAPVIVSKADIQPIEDATRLAGLLNSAAEVMFITAHGDAVAFEYKPLPAVYGSNRWSNPPPLKFRLPRLRANGRLWLDG
jgi:hypothetical protein